MTSDVRIYVEFLVSINKYLIKQRPIVGLLEDFFNERNQVVNNLLNSQ